MYFLLIFFESNLSQVRHNYLDKFEQYPVSPRATREQPLEYLGVARIYPSNYSKRNHDGLNKEALRSIPFPEISSFIKFFEASRLHYKYTAQIF